MEVVGDEGLRSMSIVVLQVPRVAVWSMVCTDGCLALIQLHASCQAALGKQAELGDDELVELCVVMPSQ